MPIGYIRAAPKIDIVFDRESYSVGDRMRAKVTIHTDRPGIKVRYASVDLHIESRYTHIRSGQVLDRRSYGAFGGRMGAGFSPVQHSPFRSATFTEDRVDRARLCELRIFEDGVIRHRTETVELTCELKAPAVRRTTENRTQYILSVHLDLPGRRDAESYRLVPVRR